jgi:hypothetical protein
LAIAVAAISESRAAQSSDPPDSFVNLDQMVD